MKNYLLVFALLLTAFAGKGQNLVPNGDFEQYSSCPTTVGQLNLATPWMDPSSSGTPDYFNQCDASNYISVPNNFGGYQPAHSGVAYGGLALWAANYVFREYIEVPLTSNLIPGTCYHFEMYVNLANAMNYATDALGIYFSATAITGISNSLPLPFTPQINNSAGFISDTLNWVLVSGNYTSVGGEAYLIIGNFNDDANTDTMLVNATQYDYAYVYVDDVSLAPCTGIEEQNNSEAINIYPNPVTDELKIAINNNGLSEIILYDVACRKLMQQGFTNSVSLNTEQLAKGIYYYEVKNKNGVIKKGKVVKE